MYDQFYRLQGRPFQLTPDPHFYFESMTHRKALSYLGYGLAQGEGFIVITGEIGAGKTTLVGHLMATIDPARLTAVQIVSTQVEGDDMLRLAAHNFGIASDGLEKAQLLGQIEQYLHGQARRGLRTLLIVDEAQNLTISALEELRMLSNFQLGGQALLQIFLLGQPEFRDLLHSPALQQLSQRVIATHHLEPMLENEIEPYVRHRLRLVGWADDPQFSDDLFPIVHALTDGVPRRVNALLNRVLLLGAIDRLHLIDACIVRIVAEDMGLHPDDDVDEEPAVPSDEPAAEAFIEPEPPAGPDVPAEQDHGDAAVGSRDLEPSWDNFAPPPASPDVADDVAGEMDRILPPDQEPEAVLVASPAPPAAPLSGTPEGDPAVDVVVEPAVYPETAPAHDGPDLVRAELAKLAQHEHDPAGLAARIEQIEARLVRIEQRSDEQEAALRRVLTLLVDWVEADAKGIRAA